MNVEAPPSLPNQIPEQRQGNDALAETWRDFKAFQSEHLATVPPSKICKIFPVLFSIQTTAKVLRVARWATVLVFLLIKRQAVFLRGTSLILKLSIKFLRTEYFHFLCIGGGYTGGVVLSYGVVVRQIEICISFQIFCVCFVAKWVFGCYFILTLHVVIRSCQLFYLNL